MLFTTLTRSAVQRTAATLARPHAAPLAAPHLALRTFAASARVRKDPGEGVGEKKPVGGDNPVSARAKGAASAVKSAVDGAIGVGQAATGEQSKLGTDEKHPGPDTRDQIQVEEDKGRKHGLAHKGKQQGAI